MKILFTLIAFFFSVTAHAEETCLSEEDLRNRSVIIEQFSRGKGSGVMLDSHHIFTAEHVITDIEKVWVKPKGDLRYPSIRADVIYSNPKADIALLKTEKPLPIVAPVSLATSFTEGVTLAGFRYGKPSRFDTISGTLMEQRVKLSNDSSPTYSMFELQNYAWGGHSGGGIYDCAGNLIAIETASFLPEGHQNRVVGVNFPTLWLIYGKYIENLENAQKH